MSFYKQTIGYIIHLRKFKNNSQIIEFFSREFGKFQIIAKGIHSNKFQSTQIQLFSLIKIQFYGNSELKNLISINLLENICFDDFLPKTSGLYLNELIHLNVVDNENVESLFDSYQFAIKNIGKIKLSTVLRKFEWQLLKHNGFEIELNSNANADDWISIETNHEINIQPDSKYGQCKVSDLNDFILDLPLNKESQTRVNKFMDEAISICLSNRRIYSKELIKSVIKLA